MTKSIWAPQAAWVYEKEGKWGNPLLPVDSLYHKVGGLDVHHVQKPPHTKINVQTTRRSWKGELVQKLLGLAKSTWSPETSRCQAALPNPKLVGPSWLMIKRSMVTTNLSWVSNLKVGGPLLVFFFSMCFHKSQVYDTQPAGRYLGLFYQPGPRTPDIPYYSSWDDTSIEVTITTHPCNLGMCAWILMQCNAMSWNVYSLYIYIINAYTYCTYLHMLTHTCTYAYV